MSNALGMYRTVKRLGIPDSNIILMLADDASCNARNRFPGSVFANSRKDLDLYGENIEVDYRGYEVTVENFIRVLTGRMDPSVPRSKRLLTDEHSNIFVYMTGHGGNEFLKFQDNEEISAHDLADAFEQMYQKKRYNEIFFMSDTCQAVTLHSKFYSPNILAVGSAQMGQNSYSHSNDEEIGVAIIDGFTHFILQYMEGINKTSRASMQELFDSFDPKKIKSQPGVRSDLFRRPLDQTLITDFFGGVAQVEVVDDKDDTAAHFTVPPITDSSQEHSTTRGEGIEMSSVEADESVGRAEVKARETETAKVRVDDNTTRQTGEKDKMRQWLPKEVRTWGVTLGLVGLIGWVVGKT
ncbi:glycosylphosphatidylinositol anchor biosynthesis protein [Coprinopsis cinerea okayama7|uniref:Glycosylphosphatidylinositol anchor biosynthesis protein n=1 Tax=Coprinopsis cinerea (strain Okayama-7 / 130 / ATCC MYA-4618 / FGSC 9003) TaxID=240176 RepID=A8ND35_COPC7|nr:glycosylphosphatidylinositol anchor biosynthesis protein [Coprinopsis cinerea okayama7\|eukprot:XP_001832689.2 glycosylphosphatidylinositol anchor biosynthesis protein [Coprinopsis cinerea okayama7\